MPAAAGGLISTDPIVTRYFYLELDGTALILSGVSGLDIELEVVTTTQNGPDGKQQVVKALGGRMKVPDISLTRMAPADAMSDPLWKWFIAVRDKGMKIGGRAAERKNGSIVLYDSSNTEVGRFNFLNGWPSKISTDALSTDSNEAVKETITIVCESIDRVK
jgi:phage tail-like protein